MPRRISPRRRRRNHAIPIDWSAERIARELAEVAREESRQVAPGAYHVGPFIVMDSRKYRLPVIMHAGHIVTMLAARKLAWRHYQLKKSSAFWVDPIQLNGSP